MYLRRKLALQRSNGFDIVFMSAKQTLQFFSIRVSFQLVRNPLCDRYELFIVRRNLFEGCRLINRQLTYLLEHFDLVLPRLCIYELPPSAQLLTQLSNICTIAGEDVPDIAFQAHYLFLLLVCIYIRMNGFAGCDRIRSLLLKSEDDPPLRRFETYPFTLHNARDCAKRLLCLIGFSLGIGQVLAYDAPDTNKFGCIFLFAFLLSLNLVSFSLS